MAFILIDDSALNLLDTHQLAYLADCGGPASRTSIGAGFLRKVRDEVKVGIVEGSNVDEVVELVAGRVVPCLSERVIWGIFHDLRLYSGTVRVHGDSGDHPPLARILPRETLLDTVRTLATSLVNCLIDEEACRSVRVPQGEAEEATAPDCFDDSCDQDVYESGREDW